MNILKLLSIQLDLFDGGSGSGTGAAAGGAMAGGNASTGAVSTSASTQQTNSGAKSQGAPAQDTSVAGENSAKTLEERRKAYRELMDGEYKDLYQEDTQGLINRRFKETKALQDTNTKQKAVMDILAQKYKIADGDVEKIRAAIEKDDDMWSEMAAEAGFDDVSKFQEFWKMQKETEALRAAEQARKQAEENARRTEQERRFVADKTAKWNAEGESLKATYPGFDLASETRNKEFMDALTFYDRAQVQNPVERAYKATHHDEIVNGAVEKARAQTEKNVVDNIRAKGKRPSENGTQSQSSFTVTNDPHNLTRAQRAEIAKRAARGEVIKFN